MLAIKKKNLRQFRRRKKLKSTEKRKKSIEKNVQKDNSENEADTFDELAPIRVSKEFLDEEAFIETELLTKFARKPSRNQNQIDREINFFCAILNDDNHNDGPNDGLKTAKDVENEESTAENQIAELSSHYFHEDAKNVIEPFNRHEIVYDESELFIPEMRINAMCPINDIELGNQQKQLNDSNENRFELKKSLQKTRVGNRDSFDGSANNSIGIVQVMNFVESKCSITSNSSREFNTIECKRDLSQKNDKLVSASETLSIYFNEISFDVHPSFSKELKIVRELMALYDEYAMRREINVVESLERKTDMVRFHINNIESTMAKIKSKSSRKIENQTTKIKSKTTTDDFVDFLYELRDLRKQLHHEMRIERAICRNILTKWKELKDERTKSGAQTPIHMKIEFDESNEERDLINWNRRFAAELDEMVRDINESYKRGMNDECADREKLSNELMEVFSSSMRPPGEEIVKFQLIYDNDKILKNDIAMKYLIRLVIDGNEVGHIESDILNNIGVAKFNKTISIKFSTLSPKNLKIQVNKPHFGKKKKFSFDTNLS